MTWATVYDVDWRDAFTSLGAVNLNAAGNSFTYEGITWATPSVVGGNPFDQKASVTWGLAAGGLVNTSPDNSRWVATNNNAPHIWATLPAIAANSVTPFIADPTRQYLFQAYVSSFVNEPTFDDSGVMVGIYMVDQGGTVGNATMSRCAWGRRSAVSNVNFGNSGTGAAPSGASRTDNAYNVLTVHYIGGNRKAFYTSPWTGPDWPDNNLLEFIGAAKDPTAFENDVVMDPPTFRVAAAINNAQNFTPNAFAATFQRFRIQQQQ